MAFCNRCDAAIFFAWDQHEKRWCPSELESIRDGDTEYQGGLLREAHHRRHRCGQRERHTVAFGTFHVGPYAKLYLLPTAPLEVVRAAHRALASLHHPDVGGDPERMIEINAAYDEITR